LLQGSYPSITAVVCTRDRTDDLSFCLDALTNLNYPKLDLLVVDNAPSNDATQELVRENYPEVRYVREPRPGLDWARNRAILEAQGEIIAFTDDDVVADKEWINALARIFIENPEVMAVTGLVIPYELETRAQIFFEMYGGFGRGFKRKWYHSGNRGINKNSFHLGAGIFGTGANMAYRRCLFNEIGGFDPALDVGTVTNGGGDLEMFFRVLHEGHVLVYEPEAVVQHRHRRKYENLKSQLTNHGIGLYAYFVRSALAYPAARLPFIRFGLRWLFRGHIRPLMISFLMPNRYPRELMSAEFRGSFIGPHRYYKARRMAAKIIQSFGQPELMPACPKGRTKSIEASGAIAVRSVDLNQPLRPLTGVENCAKVRIFVILAGRLLGKVEVPTFGQTINVPRLRDAIVDELAVKLLESGHILDEDTAIAKTKAAILRHDTLSREIPAKLSDDVSVSVVVATLDRPKDLQDCLRSLIAQQSTRQVEVIVVVQATL
jgi:GT2 family glycosyltransferase